MKHLFVIYGEAATGKSELVKVLSKNYYNNDLINKEQGVYVIDLFCECSAKEDVNKIIELFNKGEKYFNKENHMFEYYNIRKIILVGNRNLNEEEVEKIKNEVNDEVSISTFETKRL